MVNAIERIRGEIGFKFASTIDIVAIVAEAFCDINTKVAGKEMQLVFTAVRDGQSLDGTILIVL